MIDASHVSKRFIIRRGEHRQFARYRSIRDGVTGMSQDLVRRLRPTSQVSERQAARWEEFWALRDVSFRVERGEVVGIIGANGAGKSTLLKVLSRITEPTEGRIVLEGRVASLLEVGTGFHPELTGRENIFLNGPILGMSRAEVRRKFDEIVAFANVERFLETPVKRYSSGMYVRLAFAIAAHLEPEILIVDEVLAVGDVSFQRKCLGKMDEVAQSQGRTVLFVSHNMGMVRALCSRGLLLREGRIVHDGLVSEAIEEHQRAVLEENPGGDERSFRDSESGVAMDVRGTTLSPGEDGVLDLEFDLHFSAGESIWEVGVHYEVYNPEMVAVARIPAKVSGLMVPRIDEGRTVRCRFPGIGATLPAGDYFISFEVRIGMRVLLSAPAAVRFSLPGIDQFGTGMILNSRAHGSTVLPMRWAIRDSAPAASGPPRED